MAASYCELLINKLNFDDKLVRVKATVLSLPHGRSLYDSGCTGAGIETIFDSEDPEKSASLQTKLIKKTDFDGDVGRVEAVLVGRFVGTVQTPHGKTSRLIIRKIERVNKIPPYVPWPGQSRDSNYAATTGSPVPVSVESWKTAAVSAAANVTKTTRAVNQEVISLCDLMDNKARYSGQVVRTEAILVSPQVSLVDAGDTYLYHPSCNEEDRLVVLEYEDSVAAGADAQAILKQALSKGTKGSVARAKVVLVGTFDSSAEGYGHLGGFRASFRVINIERVEAVSRNVPWPRDP